MKDETSVEAAPRADVVPARRFSWAWLAPLAAVVVFGALALDAVRQRGPEITITFRQGHDLKPGDPISYRGVDVGRVREVSLATDLDAVVVHAELKPEAANIAAEGTRFWIVRPEVRIGGVSGIETILGPKYISVAPGGGARVSSFEWLDSAPRDVRRTPGALSVILEAERTGALQTGSRVFYRDEPVGVVVETGLAPDGRRVEVMAEIDPEFAHLVRDNTRFWNASGIGMDLGFTGLSFRMESLQSVVLGGVGFATPNRPGEVVMDGQRFELASSPEDSWLKWSPDLSPAPPAMTDPGIQ
ncbi:MAG: MlaD family protein [Planctomycetota bacterium]|nr:MlaD family protein [Planctomycetota bacterium]